MAWQPLHVRLGMEEGPYEGVPEHLQGPLWDWVTDAFDRFMPNQQAGMLRISAMARLPLAPGGNDRAILKQIQSCCVMDEIQFLSVIDALLEWFGGGAGDSWTNNLITNLDDYLLLGNSAWTVAPDRKGLTSRVDLTATEAVAQAIAPHDAASEELVEAWRKVYGRDPDPSDAWDHSIKAVEALLIPIVVPTQDKPHLGHVLGQLDRQDGRWELLLTTQQGITPIQTLVGMLRLIYPNPDRHPGPERRVPTLEEAQAVVHLAVTVVQWCRAGVLKKQEPTMLPTADPGSTG